MRQSEQIAKLRHKVFGDSSERRISPHPPGGEPPPQPAARTGHGPTPQLRRRQLFDRIERAELRPLPTERFEFCEWKQPRVNIDYHVEVDRHYYSVPNALVGELVDARFTASTVELLHHGKRVASHARSFVPAKHTTNPEHMPETRRVDAEPDHDLGDGDWPEDGRAR